MDIVNDQMNKRIVCRLILQIFESFVEAETHKYSMYICKQIILQIFCVVTDDFVQGDE